ncbi:MAG: hypothetical protein COV67_05305, partial [Nitrospinae bacterium CG11_big_fil_rev_8_21_14_0_20_56_8]
PLQFLRQINPHLLRRAARQARRVITFSRFSRDLVVNALGPGWEERVEVIPPGVDPAWLDLQRMQGDPTTAEILFWGRLEIEKGLFELLQAMKEVALQVPHSRLTLIGEGNQRQALEAEARRQGIASRVHFPGWLGEGEVQRLASTARLAAFPSRIESFGLSVAEAMGAGVPVVAGRAGAIPEIVADGVTGTLVPPEDPQALAAAIVAALKHPEPALRMAETGRAAIRERYSWDRAADRLIELYRAE